MTFFGLLDRAAKHFWKKGRIDHGDLANVGIALFLCSLMGTADARLPQAETVADREKDSTEYVARAWTVDDGLPHNSAWALEQDDTGHLWVGTLDGLARFDGHAFTTFTPAETPGLDGNRFHALFQASDGTLWIGTGSGLSVRRNGHFRTVEGPEYIRAMDEADDGTVWMAGYRLYRSTSDSVRKTITPVPMPDSLAGSVQAVAVAGSDSVWVSADSHLLLYHDRTFTHPYALPRLQGHDILGLATASDGSLWVGAGPYVLSIEEGEESRAEAITRYRHGGSQVRNIRLDPSGNAWVTTFGAGLLRIMDGTVQRVRTGGAIPDRVIGLARDNSDQWWVGGPVGEEAGVIRLRPRLFRSMEVGVSAHGFHTDPDGILWATFTSGDLLRISRSDTSRWSARDGLPGPLWAVTRDASGTLWVGTADGLARRRGDRFEVVTDASGTGFGAVQTLYADPAGGLWIYSNQRGLFHHQDGRFDLVFSRDSLSATRVFDLHRGHDGALWMGTRSRGVGRYDGGSLQWFDAADGVPYQAVRDVYEARDGSLWIATYGGGIARFEGDHFTPITPDDGLPDGTIHAFHEAPKGTIWMTSNGGVFRVPYSQLDAVADGRRERFYVQSFGTDDGMPSRECNGNFQTALAEGPNGNLWIPTTKGLTIVDPYDPALDVPDAVPLRITAVRADGASRALDSLRFAPSTYRLAIDFSAVSLRHAEDLTFRYQLDGGPWTPARSRQTAEFTTLDAGMHRFEVQATLDGEAWYTLTTPLRFTVAPSFYETWWFRLLVACGLLGLAGGGYAWRARVLRRQQEKLRQMVDERTKQLADEKKKTEQQAERLEALDAEKNRFFANISHELRTPLTILRGTIQDALDGTFGDVPAPLQHQLEIMHSNTEHMHRLIEQLLDLARLETTGPQLDRQPRDLVALLQRCVQQFVPLAERNGVSLNLETGVDTYACWIDSDKLEKIVDNLLSNALENTPEGGEVRVELTIESGEPPTALLHVADTGSGIPSEQQDQIFERFAQGANTTSSNRQGTGIGLALAREYTELHGGTIDVTSTPGEGSTFTVRLPVPPSDAAAVESASTTDGEAPVPEDEDHAPVATTGATTGDGVPEDASDRPVLLVVEDNDDVRAYLRRHLADTYRVVEAGGGVEGLDKARDTEPDLILTDLMMPDVDGIELCETIRTDKGLAQIPVVLLTARAAEEDAVAGLEAGADAYVTKPFSIDELKARLHRLLEAHWAGASDDGSLERPSPNVEATSADEEFLNRVTAAIDEHLSRASLTVEDLAAEVGLSRRQFHRKLKRIVGETPATFVRRYRLDAGAQLLEEDTGTVAEVAYEVGFETPETFASHFKDRFGCRPSAYPDAAPPGSS